MPPRKSQYYDEDDYDDGYDEEWDYDDEYEEEYVPPKAAKPQASQPKALPKETKSAATTPRQATHNSTKEGGYDAKPPTQGRGCTSKYLHLHAPHSSVLTPTDLAALQLQSLQSNPILPPALSRPWSEYVPPPALAAACATAAEHDAQKQPILHLVVLGHVDAGKSTLMGRLLHQVGKVDARTAHKHEKEAKAAGKGSFALAWVLDQRPEERARGVTVDIAQAYFETQRFLVSLMDAPGHRDFVPNMITGAAQADAAVLVVDGSLGGFEAGFPSDGSGDGGQTREHVQLARSLGVEQLIVVVTKLDTCEYDPQRFAHVRAQLAPFLQERCGFSASALQWLPAIGPTGDNVASPPADTHPLASWWKDGPTLLQAIDALAPPARAVERPLRVSVSDVFKGTRGGIVAGGKVEAGAVMVNDEVVIMPGSVEATVRAVHVNGTPASLARAGDGVDITLANVEPHALSMGSVLCSPGWLVLQVLVFEARVLVLQPPIPIIRGHQMTVHAHCVREEGCFDALLSLLNPTSGQVTRAKPRCLLAGQSAVVHIRVVRPLGLELYANCRPLGRIALRDAGCTLAVGVVTGVVETAHGVGC